MQSLADHQRWLASLILAPERLSEDPTGAVRPVALDDVEDARARLGAYVNGYPARLREALAEAYPAVCVVVGEDTFRALVERYRPAVPAGVYSLSDIGVSFPAFLAGDELSARLPFLHDLAALEWSVLRAFHSFECGRFDPAPVVGWGLEDWERARLRFQPSVAVRCSAWPILDLWRLRDTSPEARREIDVEIDDRPQSVLVSRRELTVSCELLSPEKAILLAELLVGATLGRAVESLPETTTESLDVGAWFAEWTAQGLVVDCRTS
jgi:hypothetical protein